MSFDSFSVIGKLYYIKMPPTILKFHKTQYATNYDCAISTKYVKTTKRNHTKRQTAVTHLTHTMLQLHNQCAECHKL